jgi:flagellar hook-associated protein 2
VSNNAQAVYDTIKDFITKYNEILKEMNDAYYAPSAKGYDPLTDEEKEVMTEDQIDKWEKKIKDSLLRRDDTLGGLINIMRTTLNEGVTVNGKTLSLSSFGISSQNYTEKGILHIYGDEDDEAVSASKNKLMDALNKNPDEVMEVVSKLTDKLYSRLMDKMKSSSLSSALTVYNDKEMDKTLSAYKSDLKRMEKKLADIEDKYYRQFAAMESAMAKINSQNSAMMSMLGLS